MRKGLNSEMWGGGIYADNLNKAINANKSEKEKSNKRYITALRKDIITCYLEMGIIPEEYFVWDFEHKNRSQRDEFLPNMIKDQVLLKKIKPEQMNRLKVKYQLYLRLKEFFKRDMAIVISEEDRSAFQSFISTHNEYFAKPIEGQCGRGAAILRGDHFDDLLNSGKWVIEELIKQSPELGVFNSTSVNTVRFPAFMKDGKFIPYAPFLRTGRADSIVDNAGAGGVFAALDAKTGMVISDGMDEMNRRYPAHPDSLVEFKGFQIPKWDELLKTAEQAHRQLSDQRYIAWDFALTDDGWCLVEANSMGQFIWQYATGIGVKKDFLNFME